MRYRFLMNSNETVVLRVVVSSGEVLSRLYVIIDDDALLMTYNFLNSNYEGSTIVRANSTVSYRISAENHIAQSGTWRIQSSNLGKAVNLIPTL